MHTEMHTGLDPPKGIWWKPAHKAEKVWVAIAFAWCMVLFAMMPLWHWKGGQNPSGIRRRVDPEAYYARTVGEFVEQYKIGEDRGMPDRARRRRAPTSTSRASRSSGTRSSSCSKGNEYTLHLSSLDVNHGFRLYPAERQLPGGARLRLRPARDPDRRRRLPHHLQRVLRHRTPHDGRARDRRSTRGQARWPTDGRATTPARRRPMTAPARPDFRTCPSTGHRIDRQAELLIKANAVVAGRLAARRRRSPRCCWCSRAGRPCTCSRPVWYYRILGVHGMNMLIFFIIFFEMAVLYFAGTVLLNARPAAPRLGWFGFALMVVGALLVECDEWSGRADVLFTSYLPLRAASDLLPRRHPLRRRRADRRSGSSSPRWSWPSARRPTPARCRWSSTAR